MRSATRESPSPRYVGTGFTLPRVGHSPGAHRAHRGERPGRSESPRAVGPRPSFLAPRTLGGHGTGPLLGSSREPRGPGYLARTRRGDDAPLDPGPRAARSLARGVPGVG